MSSICRWKEEEEEAARWHLLCLFSVLCLSHRGVLSGTPLPPGTEASVGILLHNMVSEDGYKLLSLLLLSKKTALKII